MGEWIVGEITELDLDRLSGKLRVPGISGRTEFVFKKSIRNDLVNQFGRTVRVLVERVNCKDYEIFDVIESS
tara:strand:- start:3204 stop:3419 length:216 start_codon:yes stop_codon:yes gene_type:complete